MARRKQIAQQSTGGKAPKLQRPTCYDPARPPPYWTFSSAGFNVTNWPGEVRCASLLDKTRLLHSELSAHPADAILGGMGHPEWLPEDEAHRAWDCVLTAQSEAHVTLNIALKASGNAYDDQGGLVRLNRDDWQRFASWIQAQGGPLQGLQCSVQAVWEGGASYPVLAALQYAQSWCPAQWPASGFDPVLWGQAGCL